MMFTRPELHHVSNMLTQIPSDALEALRRRLVGDLIHRAHDPLKEKVLRDIEANLDRLLLAKSQLLVLLQALEKDAAVK